MCNNEKYIIQGTVSVEFKEGGGSANATLTPSADYQVKHGDNKYAVAVKAGSSDKAYISNCKLYLLNKNGATDPFTLDDSLLSIIACVAIAQTKVEVEVELEIEIDKIISIRFPVK